MYCVGFEEERMPDVYKMPYYVLAAVQAWDCFIILPRRGCTSSPILQKGKLRLRMTTVLNHPQPQQVVFGINSSF